jgi:pyridoxal phosphate enzyme (YggS family)
MSTIGERLAAVRERIAHAAARAGRQPEEITLVAVSKTFPADAIREAFAAGCRDFGENRVQEAETKFASLEPLHAQGARWHLVGHLQANKARKAVALFDRIHSIHDADLGQRLARVAEELGREVRALVEVDLAGEATKHGLPAEHLRPTLEALRGLRSLRIEGLMVLPPLEQDPGRTRPYFRRLRDLRDELVAAGLLAGSELSMGMSHDLEVAVEEGATLVRVGTAIFGERG